MQNVEIKNAIIKSVRFDTERGLTAMLMLDYGGSGQAFGGFMLYAPKGWAAHNSGADLTGHFIYRCLEIADVDDWAKLAGRTIRVKAGFDAVHAIGHIIKDEWFEPKVEFQEMLAAHKKVEAA